MRTKQLIIFSVLLLFNFWGNRVQGQTNNAYPYCYPVGAGCATDPGRAEIIPSILILPAMVEYSQTLCIGMMLPHIPNIPHY